LLIGVFIEVVFVEVEHGSGEWLEALGLREKGGLVYRGEILQLKVSKLL
jgi:hypothetical protein